MKFKDFAEDRWMRDVLPTFKLSTRSQYSYFMRKYLVTYFGEQPLEDIRPEEVQRFFAQCKRLAPKTVRSMATALSSSFRTAVNWGFVEVNPVRGIMLPPKRTVRPRRALTPKEVQDVLAHLEEPCRMIVVLILLTGMRIGEVLAMRWGKIDWKNRTIQVDEGVYEGELSTPKTESAIRSLPMSRMLLAELQCWHGKRSRDPAEFVFHTAVGTPHCRRNLMHRQLEPAVLSAGIGVVGWHMLRRTHSTWLKDAGAAPTVIQHQLGHADPRLAFELYVMAIPGERRKAVERVHTVSIRDLRPARVSRRGVLEPRYRRVLLTVPFSPPPMGQARIISMFAEVGRGLVVSFFQLRINQAIVRFFWMNTHFRYCLALPPDVDWHSVESRQRHAGAPSGHYRRQPFTRQGKRRPKTASKP